MTKILSVCMFMFIAVAVCSPQDVTGGSWLFGSCQLAVKQMDDPHFVEDHFEAYRDGYCRGLVHGVADASPHVCPGEKVTYGQEVRVVVKYLQDHPEELDRPGSILAEKALAKGFPCER